MPKRPAFRSTANVHFERLISHGYFPSELPPPFTTVPFAAHVVELAKMWAGRDIRAFWTAPEHYSIPKYGHARRKLSIVNPINQLHVAQLIANNWPVIKQRLGRSISTEFKPELVTRGGGRAVTGVDFDAVSRRRVTLLSTYGRYVKTDIARFYPSVYTHSIAWSLLGKDWCKNNKTQDEFKKSYANHLDEAVRAGQLGQSIGIPIGPDTSRIISELIATEVEELVRETIGDIGTRSVRYVDDMLIGLRDEETAAAVLSGVSNALYEYELELNPEKTVTLGLGSPHLPEWIHYIRSFTLSSAAARQRDDLDSFFAQAMHLASENNRDNVLLFAVKRAASFALDPINADHMVRWMLYSARRSSSCLSFVAEYLASCHLAGQDLPLDEISDFIHQQLPSQASAAHTNEVAWLLFWARELSLELESGALEQVTRLKSSVCALLALDLRQRRLIRGAIDDRAWKDAAKTTGLKGEMWLVAYEATKKGWWQRPRSTKFIVDHEFFGELLKRDVVFYDPTQRARARVLRPFAPRSRRLALGGGEGGLGGYPG